MMFFVSVGMLLDPTRLWNQAGMLVLVVAAVTVGKAAILAGIVRLFGYRNVVPFATGLTLFQVGEFAFVLARVGRSSGAISEDLYALTLNTAIVTMALTPALSSLVPTVYKRLGSRRVRESQEAVNLPPTGLRDHVVIAGGGRVGQSIATALAKLRLPFVLVEFDDRRVQQARERGLALIYGDASQPVVLQAAGIDQAHALLITVPAFADVRSIVEVGRQLRPDLPIVARADGPEAVQALYALGIQEVASPEFEAAIEMTQQALIHLHVPAHEVLQVGSDIRRTQYGQAGAPESSVQADGSPSLSKSHLGEMARHLDFIWVDVPQGSPFVDRTLGELRLRTTIGASVVGIVRDRALVANPDGEARLMTGDLVAALGTREQLARFEKALQPVPPG
jgi:CPA2 family monovalent cation:H+ antiporter-2